VCRNDLKEELFSFKNKAKNKRQSICKDCAKEYKKAYYLLNKEKLINYSKKSSKKSKLRNGQFIWDYLKENSCVDCGESDPIVLEFDHKIGIDKHKDISLMVKDGYSIDMIKKEIDKCDVRCANCHRRKTANTFNWYKNIIK